MLADALRERLGAAGLLVRWPDGVPHTLSGVSTDSRSLEPGSLFVAYAGSERDGHGFIPAAVQRGASALVVERPVAGAGRPHIEVTNGRLAAAVAAALFYGDPLCALDLLAVTGTNGKTTTTFLLRHLFGASAPAGLIGTLGAIDGDGNPLPGTGALTTPGPVELQRVLASLRASGVRTVAMEASSHSLDQDRLWGMRFRAAVFTNLTREHLDYHGTEEAYLAAKLRLAGHLAPDGWEIVNADDPAWRALPPRERRLTFGLEGDADVKGGGVEGDGRGMRFTIDYRGRRVAAELPLLGGYNVSNAMGAVAAALALGADLDEVAARLSTAPQVPGRMERLATSPCLVLRDYAHTPDAMERALAAVRGITKGRLMLVFGCGGDRDRGKRPLMGAVAARDADLVVLTEDNPRSEDPVAIIEDIERGMGETPHLRIVDRARGIRRAVSIARPDDTILLAGKGHETYQIVGDVKHHFDEREIVAEAVREVSR